MPEGPEVKRLTDQLSKKLKGKVLESIHLISGRYEKSPPDGLSGFQGALPLEILDIKCKGKFIYFTFKDSEWTIWNTLGMTGGWRSQKTDHSRVKFIISNDDYFFTDVRNFGTLKFVRGKDNLENKLSSLGIDMLSDKPSDDLFRTLLRKNGKKTLPEFLMNQKYISGVGNYLKSESLYLAGINPNRTCSSLSDAEVDKLNACIQTIIQTSYSSGGSTIQAYKDLDGNSGSYSHRFMVYGKKNDPKGRQVVSYTSKDNRTTFWVPEIQT
jgi:formamidopyrimidine-DNA glycosylase